MRSASPRGLLYRALLGVALVANLLLVGCGDDDETTTDTSTTSTTSTTTSVPDDSSTTSSTAPRESVVRAYFLRDQVIAPVGRGATGPETARTAMEALLGGPVPEEVELGFVSAIPEGTELLGLVIEAGTATVDLSAQYESGGGSMSMITRVTQVVYTLTQFPTVDEVVFELEGEPVEFLGGEGLILDTPQERSDWREYVPAILVESPLPLEEVTSPLRVTGTSNTFEGTFQLNVVDGDGLIVHDDFVMATGGSGTRGTFDVTVEFDVPRAGLGAVIVFEISPRDGSQEHLVEIPVRIS